jgi:hypothetical protein
MLRGGKGERVVRLSATVGATKPGERITALRLGAQVPGYPNKLGPHGPAAYN